MTVIAGRKSPWICNIHENNTYQRVIPHRQHSRYDEGIEGGGVGEASHHALPRTGGPLNGQQRGGEEQGREQGC